LQDGTYILTDKEGRWHADNIRPGTHVVQLDLDSLPKDYKVVACADNSRFAGRKYSQFVNVRGGSLWRADFYVKKIVPPVTIVKPIAQCAPVITPPPVFEKSTFSADKIFAFGSATLNATGIVSLDEFLDKMRGVNFQSITLIGHTDPLGSETYNLTLSLKRAAAVRDYFVRNGLDAKLIEIGGTGKSEPIKPLAECTGTKGNALSECLAPNRRIEVHVTILIPAAPLPQQTDCQVPERHSKADATAAQPELIPADSPPVINESKPLGGNVVGGNITGDTNLKKAADGTPILKQVTAQSQHSLQLVEKLDYDEKWLVTATPGIEWLHPRESFQPALPAIKIAVKHLPVQRVEMKVNGERVNPLYFDGTTINAAVNLGLSLWRGVTIKEGGNLMEMTVLDAKGDVVKHEKRNIHYGGGAVKAVIDEKQSVLVADGKTQPVVAVRFLDKDGKPVRRGVSGEFQLNTPYLTQNTLNGIEYQPLAGNLGNKNTFRVTGDGVALITLQPTTHTGEVVLGFDFRSTLNRGTNFGLDPEVKNDRQEIRAWLAPGERDWILVGFAEGTVGHKKLSGNMENLNATQADEKLFDENRVAFYAKGTVKGEYLLTAAYDTAKEQGAGGARNLKQVIKPDQYYTLYADATTAQFDAASISKLYLKIEKKQFYA
ncbi:MAG: OmpA family protein, partial [Candidatus Nitrotoga sp.]